MKSSQDLKLEKTVKEVKRLDKCKHKEGSYCKKICHSISNGYAILCHCKNCKYYEKGAESINKALLEVEDGN